MMNHPDTYYLLVGWRQGDKPMEPIDPPERKDHRPLTVGERDPVYRTFGPNVYDCEICWPHRKVVDNRRTT